MPARRGTGEVGGVNALEVLDPVRDGSGRQWLQQVERPAHGGIADGMHDAGDPPRAAASTTRRALPGSASGSPASPPSV